jgi:hypothetical protein
VVPPAPRADQISDLQPLAGIGLTELHVEPHPVIGNVAAGQASDKAERRGPIRDGGGRFIPGDFISESRAISSESRSRAGAAIGEAEARPSRSFDVVQENRYFLGSAPPRLSAKRDFAHVG